VIEGLRVFDAIRRREEVLVMEKRMRRAVLACVSLGAVSLVLAGASGAAPSCATSSGTTTCTFSSTGSEQSFVVPAGVTSIQVTAIGGKGAGGHPGSNNGTGGFGATVSGTIPVTSGETLYVEVAGNGQVGTTFADGGGFNGGGNSGFHALNAGGGGGGASDVRTTSCAGSCPGSSSSFGSRLLVAGGGGGGGADAAVNGGAGGAAGSSPQAGADGTDYSGYAGSRGRGGGAGTPTQGGTGGAGGSAGVPVGTGTDGDAGQGGSGQLTIYTQAIGGGGGGGYYGGGGGGSGGWNGGTVAGGGGGGAGSSFADPSATNPSVGTDATGVPLVTIAYAATPADLLAELAGKVEEFAPKSALAKLVKKIQGYVDDNNTKKACKSFNGFASRVKGMVKVGKLSSAEATELNQLSQAVQNALGC
jgi:hypothetical protein